LSIKLRDEHKLNFEPKAICDYWWNILDPRLNHTPYSEEEKNHIYEWASKYQENGNIQWKLLQVKLETKFGR
ncbi:10085_t:CDS:2, partial [Rhizophagus irregularis]